MEKKSVFMIVFTVIVLGLCAIALVWWYDRSQSSSLDDVAVIINEEKTTEVNVTLSDFLPGDSKSYTIQMKNGEEEPISVVMSFEKKETDSLAPFMDVEIRVGGEKISEGKLEEYLNGKTVTLSNALAVAATCEVEVIYSMGIEVGDEAQNTTADFNILLQGNK